MRPFQDNVDYFLEFYFRCNATLTNEGNLFKVDCVLNEDLSDTSTLITRREDATMQCPKTIQNHSERRGVSQNLHISCKLSSYILQ